MKYSIQLELREYDCPGVKESDEILGRNENVDEEKKEASGTQQLGRVREECGNDSSDESEMRGVHACTHIPPNTICVTIPRRCLITVEMGQATPIGQAILNSDLDLDAPKHIFLMIYLLWDRKVNNRKSFFYPYYEMLPKTLRSMPIFWSQEELSELEGSYLLTQIADRNEAIAEDYHSICQIAPLGSICTIEEFKWARMCVCSRNFGLQIDGHRTSALVPHADMLNHYRPRETKWTFDEDRQAFTITSLQHIPSGAQVYDSYGQKCNHRFLLNYGFAVEDNRELDGFCPDEVPLELYVSPDDALFTQKLDFWTRGELASAASQSIHNPVSTTTPTSTSAAVAAAVALVSQKNNHNTNNGKSPSISAAFNYVSSPVIKRIRVCVSNNENTRLLFSLLRALVCNSEELKAITSPITNDHHISHGQQHLSHHSHLNYHAGAVGITSSGISTGSSSAVSRALLGLTTAADVSRVMASVGSATSNINHLSSFSGNNLSPGTTQYYRTCRDIRHPISLRNERAAMRLLLEVVKRQLTRYPSTLQRDINDLLDERAYPRFSNKRHAKIQVRGEKEVLVHFSKWAQTALNVMDVIENELEEEKALANSRSCVEVQLVANGSTPAKEAGLGSSKSTTAIVSTIEDLNHRHRGPSFEHIIRKMEEDQLAPAGHDSTRSQSEVFRLAVGVGGNSGVNVHRRLKNFGTDVNGVVHHTIIRYCADVLGSMRREEFKNLRRRVHLGKTLYEKGSTNVF